MQKLILLIINYTILLPIREVKQIIFYKIKKLTLGIIYLE